MPVTQVGESHAQRRDPPLSPGANRLRPGQAARSCFGRLAQHLETCQACRDALDSLPPDPFEAKVRAAKPSGSSVLPGPSPSRAGNATDQPKVAASLASQPPDLPPELVNHPKYGIVRELGRGGMGVVYLAVHKVMDRPIAIKVINPSVLAHPDALPRFHSEVRTAAKLDHPNIVRALDADQVGSLHLLVMEYVEGKNLDELVRARGRLAIMYSCHYVRQAALGLQHAFEQGMVHRDIKPANLILTPRGRVKILDFGLALVRDTGMREWPADGDGLLHGHAGIRIARTGRRRTHCGHAVRYLQLGVHAVLPADEPATVSGGDRR